MDDYFERVSQFQIKSARVKYILYQTVSTQQLHLIATSCLNTPNLMWNELVSVFERPSLSNKLQLLTRLLDMKMVSGSSVEHYFKDLQEITERLASLGSPIDSDFQVAIILRGLSAEYDSLRLAFVAKGIVSIPELHEALRTEEQRKNNTVDNNSSQASILTVRKNVTHKSRERFQEQRSHVGPCFGCGKFGHLHRNVRRILTEILGTANVVVMLNTM